MAVKLNRPEDNLVVALCGHSLSAEAARQLASMPSPGWSYVAQAARAHAVDARLFPRALDLALPEPTRGAVARAAKSTLKACMHDNLVFRQEIAKLRGAFAADAIDWLLLKGPSVDATMMRRTGDIDILVRRESLVAAIESVMRIPGYAYREADEADGQGGWRYHRELTGSLKTRIRRRAERMHEFQVVNADRRVLVELHVRLFPCPEGGHDGVWGAASSEAVLERVWNGRRPLPELRCCVPRAEHSLLLMCLHAALKRSPATNHFRLGLLVDIDVLITSGIEWDTFMQDCRELRLVPFAYFSLLLARRLIGAPVPANVLQALRKSCTPSQIALTRLHLRCVVSLESSSVFYSVVCRAVSPWALEAPWRDRIKGALLVHFWLPPRERMASLLGVEAGSPLVLVSYLLNPLRWLALMVAAALRMRRPQSM